MKESRSLIGLLAVAAAYLCSASFAFLQTLSFPGGYAPAGLIGDGTNTSAWSFPFDPGMAATAPPVALSPA